MEHRKLKLLLGCGAVAGPLFTLGWLAAGATRAGYDLMRHPISSLAIGELGWTQIINFLVTGLLTLAFAAGLRQRLQPFVKLARGRTWGPLLVAGIALGLIGAGIFVTDPMNGYPPGTSALPAEYSISGRLHRLSSALVFLGFPGACFVFARVFDRWDIRRWVNYSVITGIAFVVMFIITSAGFAQVEGLANVAGLSQRITLTIGWVWLTLLALYLLTALPDRPINHGIRSSETAQ